MKPNFLPQENVQEAVGRRPQGANRFFKAAILRQEPGLFRADPHVPCFAAKGDNAFQGPTDSPEEVFLCLKSCLGYKPGCPLCRERFCCKKGWTHLLQYWIYFPPYNLGSRMFWVLFSELDHSQWLDRIFAKAGYGVTLGIMHIPSGILVVPL